MRQRRLCGTSSITYFLFHNVCFLLILKVALKKLGHFNKTPAVVSVELSGWNLFFLFVIFPLLENVQPRLLSAFPPDVLCVRSALMFCYSWTTPGIYLSLITVLRLFRNASTLRSFIFSRSTSVFLSRWLCLPSSLGLAHWACVQFVCFFMR